MKQAIFGVTPAETQEGTIMIVWPSIAAYGLGRWMGSLMEIRWPDKAFFRLGNLLAPLLIPFGLALYFYRLVPSILGLPVHGKFYKLTNRRVLELRNEINFRRNEAGRSRLRFLYAAETKWVPLDRFDSIEIVRRPGQLWYDAGDLVFSEGTTETFRLEGVSRPESFRHNCLKAHLAYVGVKQARAREAVAS
jgi:hypothetical protein